MLSGQRLEMWCLWYSQSKMYISYSVQGLCSVLGALTKRSFLYAPSQWETMLQCNIVSHWLGAFTKWSLLTIYLSDSSLMVTGQPRIVITWLGLVTVSCLQGEAALKILELVILRMLLLCIWLDIVACENVCLKGIIIFWERPNLHFYLLRWK